MCIAITLTEKIGVIPKNVNEFSTFVQLKQPYPNLSKS